MSENILREAICSNKFLALCQADNKTKTESGGLHHV